jgi:hypothetical protein
LDDRYFKPKISAKNKIGELFARKVTQALMTSKHDRVRQNPKERAKLEYLDAELQNSPRLKEIEPDTDDFEKATEHEFTQSISRQYILLKSQEAKSKQHFSQRISRDPSIITQSGAGSQYMRVQPVLSPRRMGLSVSPSMIKKQVQLKCNFQLPPLNEPSVAHSRND